MEIEIRESKDREFPTTVGKCALAGQSCIEKGGSVWIFRSPSQDFVPNGIRIMQNTVSGWGSDCQYLTDAARPVTIKKLTVEIEPGGAE